MNLLAAIALSIGLSGCLYNPGHYPVQYYRQGPAYRTNGGYVQGHGHVGFLGYRRPGDHRQSRLQRACQLPERSIVHRATPDARPQPRASVGEKRAGAVR